ncbi:MAG: glycosyltransferase family 4 protein [Gammaproteobacteria bacterium]
MKVLHVLPNAGSGIETLVVSMLPYFRQQAVETHLLYLSDAIAPIAAASRGTASLAHMNIRPDPLKTVAGYRNLVSTLRPDIVHSHSMLPSLLAATGRHIDVRHVRTIHAPYPYFSAQGARSVVKRRIEGMALRYTASTVVCVSNAVAKCLPWQLTEPVLTICNGVSTVAPMPIQRKAGNSLVVAAGRLEAQKNYPRLLRAFSTLLKSMPDAKLAIAGEGSQRRMLEDMIQALKIESHTTLLGQVTDMTALYEKAGLFVLSSDYEGLGLATMEALCAGCPVVSTPIEPSREIDDILGGGMIRFAADFSPETLADAMQRALCESSAADPDFTITIAEVRERLSAEACATHYLELYRSASHHQTRHDT